MTMQRFNDLIVLAVVVGSTAAVAVATYLGTLRWIALHPPI